MVTRRQFLLTALLRRVRGARLTSLAARVGAAGAVGSAAGCGGGKKAGDASGSPTPPPPLSNSDFEARRNAPGVVRWFDFTSLGSKIDNTNSTPNSWPNVGYLPGSSNDPVLDASLGINAIRFDVPGKSGSNAGGEWYVNFSDDLGTQFGAGSTFFMQWRQRFNAAYCATEIFQTAPNTGVPSAIKQVIISAQDTPTAHYDSCVELELVCTSYGMHGFPILYQACGWYEPLVDKQPGSSSEFRLQNMRSDPFCLYSQANGRDTSVPPGCFGYAHDEWMTFQISVTLGKLDATVNRYVGSRVRFWGARASQPSHLLIDIPWDIRCGSPAQTYGKGWFGAYMSYKDPAQDHPLMQTWVAEFIVSRQPIADPVVGTIPPQEIIIASTSLSASNGSLDTLVSGNVRQLQAYGYSPGAGRDAIETGRAEYSCLVCDPTGRQMLWFGGPHNNNYGTPDYIRAFSTDSLAWSKLYAETLNRVDANFDAPRSRFISTNQPIAVHTFNGSLMIGHKYYKLSSGGAGGSVDNLCYYDLDMQTWTWSNITPLWYYGSGMALDPASGRVVVFGTDPQASNNLALYDYDPATDKQALRCGAPGAGYMFKLLYLPERDIFLAISYGGEVWEIYYNRSNPAASVITMSATIAANDAAPAAWTLASDRPPPSGHGFGIDKIGFARDHTGLIHGHVYSGFIYTYDPAARTWSKRQIKNEDGTNYAGSQWFYLTEHDPVSGCYFFLAEDGYTYAYRP